MLVIKSNWLINGPAGCYVERLLKKAHDYKQQLVYFRAADSDHLYVDKNLTERRLHSYKQGDSAAKFY